jgi:hypothetical protein
MPVYPAKYIGLTGQERANAMAGLPIGFEDLPSQKAINVTLGGSNIGTGQTTIEGARDYLAGLQSGITGQGAKFTPEQIKQALSGITGAYQTRADAEADLRARMTAFTPEELYAEEIGSYRGMLGLPRNPGGFQISGTGDPLASDPLASDNPLQALMDMLGGVTGTLPSDIVGGGGGFNINAPTVPTVPTIRRGQTNFQIDPNGLRVTVPGKSTIRIPLNRAGPGGTGLYRNAIETALVNAGLSPIDVQTVLADYGMTREGQNESAPTAEGENVSNMLVDMILGNFTGGDAITGDATGGAQNTQLDQFLQIFGLDSGTTATDVTGADAAAPADGAMPAGGDVWSRLDAALRGSDTADGDPGQFGGIFDFLNMGDEAPTGFADMKEEDWKQIALELWNDPTSQMAVEQIGPLLSGLQANMFGANADTLGTALDDLFGDATGKESTDLMTELFGEGFTFKAIKDAFPGTDPEAVQLRLTFATALGQQNLGLFQTLLSNATNERQFAQALMEFTEDIKVRKQDQQITVINKMADITLGQMQLDQTAKDNLMTAQIAAMNTALKSKELSQAEAADLRQNMLDAVALEQEAGRIDNEQANFLMTHLLSQQGLALQIRELDQRGQIAEADRALERESMALTERLGLADIAAGLMGREAELQFGREGLAQERELGFAGIGQRREEAAMSAQVALLNAAMQNPYSFAALSSLGGIPGMAGGAAPAAAAVSPTGMFPSLAGLGFQIPETAQAGTTTPAPAFFTGGMPTVGALGELDPASLQFLTNVLAFSGTPPEGLGRMAGAVTPAAGGFQGLGRTFFG